MSGDASFRIGRRLALVLTMAAVATGCVTAEATPTPSTEASGSASPATSPIASAAAPAATPTPAQTIGLAPSGEWTSLTWVRIADRLLTGYPSIPPNATEKDENGQATDIEGPNVNLESVKDGYLQLLWDPVARTLTPWLSSDTQAWRQGQPFDLSRWKSQFADWDKMAETTARRSGCQLIVDDFAAGSGGNVVRAHFECMIGCGSMYVSDQAMWASPDALDWSPVDLSKTFGKSGIDRIAGGGNGFIGLANGKKAAWTSVDGRSWRLGPVPSEATELGHPVSISGDFVLGGVVRKKSGAAIPPGGICGNPESIGGGLFAATAWVSKDGTSWESHPIAPATASNAVVELIRVDDHTLIADVTTYTADASGEMADSNDAFYLSRDGRTWTTLTTPSEDWYAFPISFGDRGLIETRETNGQVHYAVSADGSLHKLSETTAAPHLGYGGEVEMPPTDGSVQSAIGPVGLLVTNGTTFWLGIPSAG